MFLASCFLLVAPFAYTYTLKISPKRRRTSNRLHSVTPEGHVGEIKHNSEGQNMNEQNSKFFFALIGLDFLLITNERASGFHALCRYVPGIIFTK
jgi:hypothetical protein